MKKLILMRHAKSSWAEPMQDDFDRTLNERGKADAPEMGRRLAQKNIQPDLILCSAAKRTHKTARLLAGALGYPEKDIQRELDLYESDARTYMDVIRQISDDRNTVVLIAHNPTITGMVGYLTSSHVPNMPTAAQAQISFGFSSWKQAAPGTGTLDWFDYPRNPED